MFGKIFINIFMMLKRSAIDRSVQSMREDPDIKEKFKKLENALQELKDATEREKEYSDSEERNAALKSLGVKRIKY